jgi:hypothetical protein
LTSFAGSSQNGFQLDEQCVHRERLRYIEIGAGREAGPEVLWLV